MTAISLFTATVVQTFLLGGCATGPLFDAQQMQPLEPGQARIIVIRDCCLQGAGTYPEVLVDGQLLGDLKPGSFAMVNVKPGNPEVVFEGGSWFWSTFYGRVVKQVEMKNMPTLNLKFAVAKGVDLLGNYPAGYSIKLISEAKVATVMPNLRAIAASTSNTKP